MILKHACNLEGKKMEDGILDLDSLSVKLRGIADALEKLEKDFDVLNRIHRILEEQSQT